MSTRARLPGDARNGRSQSAFPLRTIHPSENRSKSGGDVFAGPRTRLTERQCGYDRAADLFAALGRKREPAEFGELEPVIRAPVGGAHERPDDLRALLEEFS